MDITEEQLPPTLPKPPTPEKGLPPEDGPDTGARPDLKNPETPDEEIPGKPISDMDPPGQDEPEMLEIALRGYGATTFALDSGEAVLPRVAV